MKHVLSSHLFINHRLTVVWLDRVLDAGISAVEIFCARQSLDYRDRAQINELAHWFRDSELELWSLHAPMYTDDVWGKSGPHSVVSITETSKPRRVANVDEIKRAIEIAEKIPFRYLVQHLGVSGEEWDDAKVDAAFTCLEDLKVFAGVRGVEVLLENIPNAFSSSDRLRYILGITHLDINFCFDVGHANMMEGIEPAYERMKDRIRSTHIHNNDGVKDLHLFPYLADGGNIDWNKTMKLLRSRPDQYPLLLELREVPDMAEPFARANEVFDRLENEQ
ncbi:MAG: sugar phosphate isomerase/epimerase [Bryobacteraceae bacterium]|nr:sugar phosphate isomerase/epimerase [Bryobacteraceae bacterium]